VIRVFVAFFFPWPRMPRMDTNFTTLTLQISDRSESREAVVRQQKFI
jgi:hypothetical protein